MCDHSSAFNFKWIFFILADKKDKSLDEFEFCQDPITYYAVSSLPLSILKNIDNVVTILVPNCIFYILSDVKDNNKSFNEFEFEVDPTLDCGGNCSLAS